MRRNAIIFALALIAVTVAYFFLVFSPQGGRISETRDQADAEEQRVTQLQAELSRLQALQRQAPQLRERAQQLDTAIPADPQLAQFILQVNEAAIASGVDWLSTSQSLPAPVQAAPAGTTYSSVNVSLQVTGGYFQVQDYIARLEGLARAVKVGSLALAPGELPQLSAALTLQMYVSPPAAPVPPAAPAPTGA